jgi:hypothetical protein
MGQQQQHGPKLLTCSRKVAGITATTTCDMNGPRPAQTATLESDVAQWHYTDRHTHYLYMQKRVLHELLTAIFAIVSR